VDQLDVCQKFGPGNREVRLRLVRLDEVTILLGKVMMKIERLGYDENREVRLGKDK
jgi:hypothetical protein